MEQLILRILKNSFEIDAEIRTKFDEMGGVDILLEMQNSKLYKSEQFKYFDEFRTNVLKLFL